MLVDQKNTNILPLAGELVESTLDGRDLGLLVHDEVVLLTVWGVGDVLYIRISITSLACAGVPGAVA